MVQCIIEESGEHIIAGAGELHLEICLKVRFICDTRKEKKMYYYISKLKKKKKFGFVSVIEYKMIRISSLSKLIIHISVCQK